MAEDNNTFLSANEIYEEVEGEAGKALTLEESQELNQQIIFQQIVESLFQYPQMDLCLS